MQAAFGLRPLAIFFAVRTLVCSSNLDTPLWLPLVCFTAGISPDGRKAEQSLHVLGALQRIVCRSCRKAAQKTQSNPRIAATPDERDFRFSPVFVGVRRHLQCGCLLASDWRKHLLPSIAAGVLHTTACFVSTSRLRMLYCTAARPSGSSVFLFSRSPSDKFSLRTAPDSRGNLAAASLRCSWIAAEFPRSGSESLLPGIVRINVVDKKRAYSRFSFARRSVRS